MEFLCPNHRQQFADLWGTELRGDPGMRIPNMLDAATAGEFKGMYIQGEDIAQSDPNTAHVTDVPKVRRADGDVHGQRR